MANYTTNYNLKKPLEAEKYSVDDQNENMDILDGEIKRLDGQTADLVKVKKNITILSTGWSNAGLWFYDITDVDIDSNTVVDVNLHLFDKNPSSYEIAQEIGIKSTNQSHAGYVRIYADTQPTTDLRADLKIVKQAGGV